MSENYLHKTVLLDEAVNGLNIKPDGVYIDGTFGRGGHSRLILSKLGAHGKLFAIDRDTTAIEAAMAIDDKRFTIIHGPFSAMAKYMDQWDLMGKVNGILLDLGVSSPQLEDPKRGFSFMRDGPLDMRMDITCGESAAQWLARASEKEIFWVLKTFGEERCAKRIAKRIFEHNLLHPVTTTSELAALISKSSSYYDKHKHPATRSFLAIRIYINRELEEIKHALNSALKILAQYGRLSVISFHSLEDRLVKQFIRYYSRRPLVPTGLALTEVQIDSHYYDRRQLKSFGKVQPSAHELSHNSRARSSVLRLAEKIVP